MIQRILERGRLRFGSTERTRAAGIVQDRRQVDAAVSPLREGRIDVEQIDTADEIVEPRDAKLRHQPARLLGDEEEEVDDVLRFAGVLRAQPGSCVAMPTGHVLRWQARIMMQPVAISAAVAKPISSGAEQRGTTMSRPVLSWPSVCTQMRRAQVVPPQRLVRLCEPDSQGMPACIIDVESRCRRAAVVAGDETRGRLPPSATPLRPCPRRLRRPASRSRGLRDWRSLKS